MNCCKEHLSWLKKDIKKHGKHCWGWCDDADKRFKCDVDGCKNRAFYEVFWDDKPMEDIDLKECVPLDTVKDNMSKL